MQMRLPTGAHKNDALIALLLKLARSFPAHVVVETDDVVEAAGCWRWPGKALTVLPTWVVVAAAAAVTGIMRPMAGAAAASAYLTFFFMICYLPEGPDLRGPRQRSLTRLVI